MENVKRLKCFHIACDFKYNIDLEMIYLFSVCLLWKNSKLVSLVLHFLSGCHIEFTQFTIFIQSRNLTKLMSLTFIHWAQIWIISFFLCCMNIINVVCSEEQKSVTRTKIQFQTALDMSDPAVREKLLKLVRLSLSEKSLQSPLNFCL